MRCFRRSDHSDLNGIHADVRYDAIHLRDYHIRGNGMDALHTQRVLRRNGGYGGHRMAAQHRKGPDVRPFACPGPTERQSVVLGKGWAGTVDSGARRLLKKKNNKQTYKVTE